MAKCVGIIALIALLNGCCTGVLMDRSREPHTFLFNPSAVYRSTNEQRVVLEGTYSNHPPTSYIGTPQLHGYLMISLTNAASSDLWTNANRSIKEIAKLPVETTSRLKQTRKLPSGYEKISDLPPNKIALEINQTHPNRAVIIFVPFALVIDVVLFPIEFPVMYAFGKYGPG